MPLLKGSIFFMVEDVMVLNILITIYSKSNRLSICIQLYCFLRHVNDEIHFSVSAIFLSLKSINKCNISVNYNYL